MKQLKFNADMLRLVEAGLKTQTRRPVEPEPIGTADGDYCDPYNGEFGLFTFWTSDNKMRNDIFGNVIGTCHFRCPYGIPGDIVPIRGSKSKAKIKNVRVQRLQEISEDDALAEGVTRVTKDGKVFKYCVYDDGRDNSKTAWSEMPYSPIVAFKNLWNSIYAAKGFGWDENPWVWVIEFEAVKP